MTPERWQAVIIAFGVAAALVIVITFGLERIAVGTASRIGTALVFIVGFVVLSIYSDQPYAEAPALTGIKGALVGLSFTQIGLIFGRRLRRNGA